jgi:hypothetical protein
MNSLSRDKDGNWTVINSSTNKKRMNQEWWVGSGGKNWTPSKNYLTAEILEEVWNEQEKVCYWFKIPLDFGLLYNDHPDWLPKHPMAPSVDRIDDSKDYTKDNIVICCRFANLGRNIYPFDKFHDVVKLIVESNRNNYDFGVSKKFIPSAPDNNIMNFMA